MVRYYRKIDITDIGGTKRTVGDEEFGSSITFRGTKETDFVLFVSDVDKTFKNNYEVGSMLEVYVDNVNPPTTKALNGFITTHDRVLAQAQIDLQLFGMDKFHYLTHPDHGNLHVAEIFGVKAKTGAKLRELFARYLTSFDITNILDTDVDDEARTLPRIPFIHAVNDWADHAGATWFVDALDKVYFFPEASRASGLSIVDADLISDAKDVTLTPDLRNMRNSITVEGGATLQVDQQQDTGTLDTFVSLHDKFYAVKFIPIKIKEKQVELPLSIVGTPPDDLVIRIVEDSGGNPSNVTALEVASTRIQKSFVTGVATFRPAGIKADLITGKTYWIVTNPVGDASNTFKWHYDNTSGVNSKSSTDFVSWTALNKTLSFRIKEGKPVQAVASNDSSIIKYKLRELIIKQPNITENITAKRLALALVNELSVIRETISNLVVYAKTKIPQPEETIPVTISDLDITAKTYKILETHLDFPSGEDGTDRMTLTLGDPLPSVEQKVEKVIRDLRLEVASNQEIVILDRVRSLARKLKLTENITVTPNGSVGVVWDGVNVRWGAFAWQ